MYIVEDLDASLKCWGVEDLTPKSKGVVSSYQIGLTLSSVAETDLKTNQSQCNLQFSISRHAGGKVLSLENHHSLF